MEYRQHQLDNGLAVLGECNDQAHFASLGLFVRTGSRDEAVGCSGVSHFLEHMVFKGSESLSAEAVNVLLDELGSSSNAQTSEESTIYHASVLPEFQSRIVNLLRELMRPALREEDFETERKVILEEIMMYQDQPPYGGHELLMRAYFGAHPLGQSVLGSTDSVGALTPQQMHEYLRARYTPGNLAVAAAGRVDFDELVRDVESCFGDWPAAPCDRPLLPVTPRFGAQVIAKENSTLQYVMELAPGPSIDDPDRYATRLWTSILGGDGGSRLYWEMLDSGAAESAGIGSYEFQGTGLIMSWFCGAPEQAADNLQRMRRVQQTASEGLTERELDLAKQKIISQILLASERTESRLFSIGWQWLNGHSYLAADDIAERFRRVTMDDIRRVAATYSLARQCSLAIGPLVELAL